jgi:hypothetical protein
MPAKEAPMPTYYFADSQNVADIAADDEELEFDASRMPATRRNGPCGR